MALLFDQRIRTLCVFLWSVQWGRVPKDFGTNMRSLEARGTTEPGGKGSKSTSSQLFSLEEVESKPTVKGRETARIKTALEGTVSSFRELLAASAGTRRLLPCLRSPRLAPITCTTLRSGDLRWGASPSFRGLTVTTSTRSTEKFASSCRCTGGALVAGDTSAG